MKATHQGVLGPGEIPCYVLEGGRRVLSGGGMLAALGMKRGSNPRLGGDRLANFAAGKTISPFLSAELASAISLPIRFTTPHGGSVAYGYEATVLVELCEAVLKSRDAKQLNRQQYGIAHHCELLLRGFARVGIIALVDEATGYQDDRAKDALAIILEKFIQAELRPWVKTFPADFYKEMFRLRGWEFSETTTAKPSIVGHYTNNIVYARLAPGVREELQRIVPRDEKGRLKHRLHQHLTENIGVMKLREHLVRVTTMMEMSKTWDAFRRRLDERLPVFGGNYALALDLDETE